MKQQAVLVGSLTLLLLFRSASCASVDNVAKGVWDVQGTRQSLTVKAHGAPLAEVLQAVAEKTGLVVYGGHLLKGETEASFADLPLLSALSKLLYGVNYFLQEPSELNGFRYVLSVVPSASQTSVSMPSSPDASAATAPALPAYAGYVPEQYRRLYDFAKTGDVEALRKAATNGDATTQALAVQLLARQHPADATRIAAEAAASPDPNRRLNAIQSLAELDNADAAKALGQALRDPDTGIRQAAVLGLHGQTSVEAIPLLTQALQDKEAAIRLLAVDILMERGTDGAAGVKEALQSDDPKLRDHARELLERLAGAE